jgi:UDP-N-acetylenolpyruvoylglucosamine reductase
MTLAKAIQTSVYERFGLRLEPESVVVQVTRSCSCLYS